MAIGTYNPYKGQKIKTGAGGTSDAAFIAHYTLPAAGAIAADDDYIVEAIATTAVVQALTAANFAHVLATPKVLSVKSVTVGQTGDVLISGTDQSGAVQTETIAINDNGSQSGTKVFATVTGVTLPAARYQVGKAPVKTAAVTKAGNVTVTVTAAAIAGAVTTGNIALLATDTKAEVATKLAAGMAAKAEIAAGFTCEAVGEEVFITAKAFAAQDATYNITLTDGGGTGATLDTYAGVVAGIPSGNLIVGVLGSFGIPFALPHDTVVKILNNKTATTVAAGSNFDSTDVNKNYIQPTAALNNAEIDVYLLV
jgi:hypothetical protein